MEHKKLELLRKEFPALSKVHYFNNGTNGPLPRISYEAMKEEADKEYYQGRYLPFIKELYEDMDQTRRLLANILKCSYEEVALTQSTTEAINIVLWGFKWHPGDEVITTTIDHTSVLAPLALLKSRQGIAVKYISVEHSERYVEENFLKELESQITNKTKLIVLPHVSFATGMTFPIKEISKICRKYDIQLLVDGAQGLGALDTDIYDLDVDYYAIAGRKWLLGPEGVGALYIKKNRISNLDPTFVSPASVKNRHEIDLNSPFYLPAPFAARYHTATAMYSPILKGFKASLEFMIDEVGINWATERIKHLSGYVRSLIEVFPGVQIVTPKGTEAGFIHFLVKGWNPVQLSQKLNEKNFMVRPVPKQHAPAPVRISLGFYLTEDELNQFSKALEEIIVNKVMER
ncbi:aminotransferase class V-fold PLP-dependent enzyme [Acidaminobacter sp. JC074]|uniref:aminotransferase class V-fold PLP-dependent enzyme n=1 Tax=Acidaminobacter sp. JC074 TaxID=2530199 RepID=UPI001F10AEC3|nr:aminotransferase class V-fold PLP-dependent enzyme [Acidaminobacter sp. JC074]